MESMYQGINKCQLSPKVDGENKFIHTFQPIEDCSPFLISDFWLLNTHVKGTSIVETKKESLHLNARIK